MKDDRLYLIHISECINRIEEYVAEGKEFFFRDAKTQDAVLRNLQMLAKAKTTERRIAASRPRTVPLRKTAADRRLKALADLVERQIRERRNRKA